MPLDLDPTATDGSGRDSLALTVRSSENMCMVADGSVIDGGCTPVVVHVGEGAHGACLGVGKRFRSTESSIPSYGGNESRLELAARR
jgi:hypothetical protein